MDYQKDICHKNNENVYTIHKTKIVSYKLNVNKLKLKLYFQNWIYFWMMEIMIIFIININKDLE